MNFIYRIYEVNWCQISVGKEISNPERFDTLLNQEVMITESRETFKKNLRELYPNIKFANNGKLKHGDIYCIIISDNCYNIEEYLNIKEYECDHCHKIFKSNLKLLYKYWSAYIFKTGHISDDVFKDYRDEINNLHFCSKKCEIDHIAEVIKKLEDETRSRHNGDIDVPPDTFISKNTFMINNEGNGYIYKITKRSTKEFYVGQTKYVPIFRWGQHLLTERFNINKIADYIFEILEVVKDKNKLNKREAYWINKCRDANPELSLNIMIPKEKL